MAATGDVRGTIRSRGEMLEAVIKVGRRKVRKATGLRVGQEAEAEKVLALALAELQAEPAPPAPAPAGVLTLRAWGEAWIEDRKTRGKRELGQPGHSPRVVPVPEPRRRAPRRGD